MNEPAILSQNDTHQAKLNITCNFQCELHYNIKPEILNKDFISHKGSRFVNSIHYVSLPIIAIASFPLKAFLMARNSLSFIL